MTPDAGAPTVSDKLPVKAGKGQRLPAATHGEARAAWLIDEATLLIAGAADGTVPEAAEVVSPAGEVVGTIRSVSWSSEQPGGAKAESARFVALLAVENVAAIRLERVELADGSGPRVALSIPRFTLNPQAVVTQLAASPLPALPGILDFLGAGLTETAAGQAPVEASHAARVVTALLNEISKPDGFVEVFGPAEDGGTVIEGWSFHLRPGIGGLIVETHRPLKRTSAVGVFDRPDLLPNALGIVAYFRGGTPVDPKDIRRIHYRTASGYFHLSVAEARTILATRDTVPHLRARLTRTSCDAQTMRAFKRTCRPRFEGRETISTFAAPVRAVVDLAVTVPEAGIFVCGWLLDPLRRVERVVLRGTDGFYLRVDDIWGRLLRQDVTETFRTDPLLGPAVAQAPSDACRHGFAVFAPRPNAGHAPAGLWLEIVLTDETAAFLPFPALDGAQEGVAARLLTCLNPADAAVRSVVERHLAPASVAATRRGASGGDAGEVVPIGNKPRGGETPRLSIVLPLADGAEDIDINLACLAGEAAAVAAELIVVASGGADSALADRLDHYTRFYGFGGRLAMIERTVTRHQAIAAGARLATGEALLFLAPDVLPRGQGWLGGLFSAFRANERTGLVSPTLLYEDDSIRFAGMPLDEVGSDMPVPKGPGRYTGYPRHWLTQTASIEVLAGTSECCLMPRRLFDRVGGFARDLLGGPQQDIALGLRLRAAGRSCVWTPRVSLYAVDPASRTEAPGRGGEIARMVDEWSFARTWERHRAEHATVRPGEVA
ncbi:MAG: hypothetical protein IT563_09620 [Alphaproteobacteria bacterium]|nr:hypothetical protein [Alphaproteobacteria bacterium]